ncbi:MAG: thiamine pyrophosphate-binding protein [Vicinamibacterales bacterium]
MNGAEALVAMLAAYRVEVIFGLPGDTSIALYDALSRQDAIRHVLTRDERSAAFMADAYARLHGTPGVTEGPSGGGATYMLPGIAEAHHSSVPVLALTTDNSLAMEHQGALTALDQEALFRPVTKWSATVKRADLIPHVVRRAFRIMTSGRPGAVHLGLPKNILEETVRDPDLHAEAVCARYPAFRTRPSAAEIERAAVLLAKAQRPVMLCGGGVHLSGAHAEVERLAELAGMAVATSINGKGSISERHRLSLGVAGANGGKPLVHEFIEAADLVLAVGTRLNYVTTNNWTALRRNPKAATIQVDIDGSEIGNNVRVDVGLAGDAAATLADLASALEGRKQLRRDVSGEIREKAEAWKARDRERAESGLVPIRPQLVMAALARATPPGAVVVADPGTPTPFLAASFALGAAGRFTVIPRAHGGLGYAVPASLGASFARPGVPIVCLTGDGSFGFSAGELETVSRIGAKIAVIQFNNSAFGWIKALQHARGYRYFGVELPRQDCAEIARAFGWEGMRVTEPGCVEAAIRRALSSERPAFVDIVTADEVEEPF